MADGLGGVLGPAEGGTGFDGDGLGAHGSRQDRVLVGGGLALEGLPARHGDDANLLALGFEFGASLAREFKLGTGTDEDDVASLARGDTLDDVRTLHGTFHGGTRKVRHDLAGKRQGGRGTVHGVLDRLLVATRGFVTVSRAAHVHTRHGAEGRDVLNRLVRRAILTDTNGIVGHDEDGTGLGESRNTHGATHVIGEDEEGRAVRDDTRGVQLHAVGDGAHTVLTDTEANVALGRSILLEVTELLHQRHVGRGEIRGTTHETRDGATQSVKHGLGVDARGDTLVFRSESRESLGPVSRELTGHDGLEFGGILSVLGLVGGPLGVPFGFGGGALFGAIHVRLDGFRNFEFTVLPLQVVAGSLGFVLAERGTVNIVGVRLVRGTVADERRHLDQRRARVVLGGVNRGANAFNVGVTVLDVLGVPAVRGVTSDNIFREGDVGVAINGDVVVVVEDDQLAEAPVTSQRGGFTRHTFHVATITHDTVGVVVNDFAVRLVEAASQVLFNHRETDGVAETHTERTGGDFDAFGDKVFGVTRGLGIPLAELLDVFNLFRSNPHKNKTHRQYALVQSTHHHHQSAQAHMHTSASSALVCGHSRRAHAARDAARVPTTADDARTISPPYHISNTYLGPHTNHTRETSDETTPTRDRADWSPIFRAYPRCDRITRTRATHAHTTTTRSHTHRHRRVTRQVHQRILQHAPVTGGQHESIAVEPLRILRVVRHRFAENHVAHRRAAHGQTRVTRVGLVDGIDGQETNGVDAIVNRFRLGARRGGDRARSRANDRALGRGLGRLRARERRGARDGLGGGENRGHVYREVGCDVKRTFTS